MCLFIHLPQNIDKNKAVFHKNLFFFVKMKEEHKQKEENFIFLRLLLH